MSAVLLVAATWLVIGSAATYVWVTWWMRVNDRQTAEQARPDWDADLRDLIEDHRT